MLVRSARPISIAAVLIAFVLAASICLSAIRPAIAETAGQTSTRNIILGAAAAVTAIILYNNYEHKKAQANTIVGRTADGGIVYGNGRVVYPNGRVYYPSNDGRTPCSYDGNEPYCNQHSRLYSGHRRGHASDRDREHQRENGDNEGDNQTGDH